MASLVPHSVLSRVRCRLSKSTRRLGQGFILHSMTLLLGRVGTISRCPVSVQAEHISSCRQGGSSTTYNRQPSSPWLYPILTRSAFSPHHFSWGCIAQTFTAKRRPASAPNARVTPPAADVAGRTNGDGEMLRARSAVTEKENINSSSRARLAFISSQKDGPAITHPRTEEVAAAVGIMQKSAQVRKELQLLYHYDCNCAYFSVTLSKAGWIQKARTRTLA